MADEADLAHELEELERRHALANRRSGAQLTPRGTCYNCGEPLAKMRQGGKLVHLRLFCDGDCADDWDRRQRAQGRA